MDVQSSDMEIQVYSNSSSSGYSDSFTSESMKLREDMGDGKDNCILLTNGPITMSLMEAKLWYTFLKAGTEMIINRTGRRMFPYVEFSLRGVDPVGLYDVVFDIIPASNKCFKFLNNKWVPIGKKEHEFKTQPFKHPDSPRIGSEWMTRKISFEKVKLSNKPGSKSGIFTLHTQQKYFVRISVVKHEKGDEVSVVEFPIQATTFIAVTAYNNREVAELKINSNPYSKAFRYPVKRMKIHSIGHKDPRSHGNKHAKKKSSISSLHSYQEIRQHIASMDVSSSTKEAKTTNGSTDMNNEKGIQTDISMADIQSWYKFLASPLATSFFDMSVPLPIFPHVNGNMCEQENYSVYFYLTLANPSPWNGYNGHKGSVLRRRFLVPPSATSSSSDNQNDVEMQNKINDRNRAREERHKQHFARNEASNKQNTEDVQKSNGRKRTTEERLEHFNSRMEKHCDKPSEDGGAFLPRRFMIPAETISSSSDTQKEEELQNKNNSRERLIREERLEEYNARIEMWKRDKD
ncbi:uncharacterized protein LOC111127458 [Crassostrea virginica]